MSYCPKLLTPQEKMYLVASEVADEITDRELLDESIESLFEEEKYGYLDFRGAFVDYLGNCNIPSEAILHFWKTMMSYGSILKQIYQYTANFPSKGKPFMLHTYFAPNFVEDAEGNRRPLITLALPQELQEKIESFNNEDFTSCFGILEGLADKIHDRNCPSEIRLLNCCRFRKVHGIMYLISSRRTHAPYLDEFEGPDSHGNFKIPIKPFNNFIRNIPASYWLK